jgi:hypothetical protein
MSYGIVIQLLLKISNISKGMCVGLIRGRSLKYERDSAEKMYYKESYLSLLIDILVIFAKWGLKFMGAVSGYIIELDSLTVIHSSAIMRL